MESAQGDGATAGPARLTDERVLEIVGEELTALTGQTWTMEPGPLLKGPGSSGVRPGIRHHDDFRHVDLEFLLNAGRPAETSLIDCGTGRRPEPEAAVREAVATWAVTTARVGLEVLTRRGEYGTWLPPRGGAGFPGWHAVVGEVAGWTLDEDGAPLKQRWFGEAHPWKTLAPLLAGALDRGHFNGIRLMVGQGGDFQTAEVRVNGRLHEEAGRALLAMDWPRTAKMSVAHLFILLLHREEPETAAGESETAAAETGAGPAADTASAQATAPRPA